MKQSTENAAKLAPPGAGIPWPVRIVARYFILPKVFRGSWEEANEFYQKQLNQILTLVDSAPDHLKSTRVLIDPLRGLEDSSRYWSVAMTLEHLVIVGSQMATGIEMLSKGQEVPLVVDVAKVKPLGEKSFETAYAEFRAMTESQIRNLNQVIGSRESKTTLRHPWFGPFNAHQWNWMLGIHAQIHRKQIKQILQKLNGG